MTVIISIYSKERHSALLALMICLAEGVDVECTYMLIQHFCSPGEELNKDWKWEGKKACLW